MFKKKILITGGSGFLGKNILELLKNRDDLAIYNLDRDAIDGFGEIFNIKCNAESYDFSDLKADFDYIVNLLALSNEKFCSNFTLAEKINVDFTKRLLEFAKSHKNLKKFIHLSSTIIYDDQNKSPVSEADKLNFNYTTYAFTKGISEKYVNFYSNKFKIHAVIFRLSNVYGPYQKFEKSPFLVPSKIVQGIEKKRIEVFNLKPKRDWIYSKDAARAIVSSLDSDIGGIYNLASGQGIEVEEIIKEISIQLDVPYFSLNIKTLGPQNLFCDISKIKRDLGWYPETKLKNGIKQTICYIKENYEKNSNSDLGAKY